MPPCDPREVLVLSAGDKSAKNLVADLKQELVENVWIVRLFSCVGFIAAIALILNPLVVAPEIMPCGAGHFLGKLVGWAVHLVALLVGSSLFLLFTAVCWIAYRPLVGFLLAAAALGLLYLVKKTSDRSRETEARGASPNAAHDAPPQVAYEMQPPFAPQTYVQPPTDKPNANAPHYAALPTAAFLGH